MLLCCCLRTRTAFQQHLEILKTLCQEFLLWVSEILISNSSHVFLVLVIYVQLFSCREIKGVQGGKRNQGPVDIFCAVWKSNEKGYRHVSQRDLDERCREGYKLTTVKVQNPHFIDDLPSIHQKVPIFWFCVVLEV